MNARLAYMIVPLCGAFAVWLTYALGRSLGLPGAGAAARKYVSSAEFVRTALPPNALLIGMQHSGSLWFYTSRPIVRWDYVKARELPDVLGWASSHGYQPFLIVDREEFERLNARFLPHAQHGLGRLRTLARFGDATIYAIE